MNLPSLFSDHMVLQRDREIPVWGWGAPGEKIEVSLAGNSVSTRSNSKGAWSLKLPPMAAGGPHEMRVLGSCTVLIRDLWVGEVWLCSGQSNMEMGLKEADSPKETIAGAKCPQIRVFTAAQVAGTTSRQDVAGTWEPCSPRAAGRFSAVGYHFGRILHQRLEVPVGLIVSAWGGTNVESWIPREALASVPFFRKRLHSYERKLRPIDSCPLSGEKAQIAEEKAAYPADPGNIGWARGWADPEHSAADWRPMELPRFWQEDGFLFSGVFWFRKEVDVPAAWAGRDLILRLCPCDKHDITYFNNEPVGAMGEDDPEAWGKVREYRVPGRLVRVGRNLIAVRIYSYVYSGGMKGDPADMSLRPVGRPGRKGLPLAGSWRFRIEHNFGAVTTIQNCPSTLYRGMIEPIATYAIRGVIWYQGESNVGRAREYRALFPLLIRSWRKVWRQGNFPFLFAQLPNYLARQSEPGESDWAELRDAQAAALSLPRTGMAVLIDLGEADDIHPRNKRDVGARLAALALRRVFRQTDVQSSGPRFRSCRREGEKLRLRFSSVHGGLQVQGARLTGFTVAAADRRFFPADAKIEKGTVLVSHPLVARPVAVRYAWADNPDCNLVNAAGLPAAPFRSDRWRHSLAARLGSSD